MDRIQRKVAAEFLQETGLDDLIDAEVSKIGRIEANQRFLGHKLVGDVMDRLKKNGFKSHCTYLQSIDRKSQRGKVAVVWIYSSYADSSDQKYFTFLDEDSICVARLRGWEVLVWM
jgi:hypothetical protein